MDAGAIYNKGSDTEFVEIFGLGGLHGHPYQD
jgi:hypothetical protein